MKNADKSAFASANGSQGLTKREYFAGIAMQGILATDVYASDPVGRKELAKKCIDIADELLNQLETK